MKRFYSPTTGGFYSDEEHAVPRPDDAFEISEAKYNTLMTAQQRGKEIVYTTAGLTARAPVKTMASIRAARNRKLRNTDWTQAPDVPETTRAAYVEYRRALRDVPQNYPNPEEVVWPSPPNASS